MDGMEDHCDWLGHQLLIERHGQNIFTAPALKKASAITAHGYLVGYLVIRSLACLRVAWLACTYGS